MSKNSDDLTIRERMGLRVLFWMLGIIKPTGYSHHVDQLRREIFEEAERAKRTGGDHD